MIMKRREFIGTIGMAAAALSVSRVKGIAANTRTEFSITMDDFHWQNAVHLTAAKRNRAILDVLAANRTKAALFVIGGNIDSEEGKALLRPWDEASHIIGNHTYSHRPLSSAAVTAPVYEQDILRAEALLKDFRHFRRLFRYPLLKEGNTAEKRDHVRAFLKNQGYRIGHVSIDNSDWAIDQRLTAKLKKDPNANTTPYRDF